MANYRTKILTDRAIKTLKPGDTRQEIPDGGLPGLYLVLQTSGSKSFACRYRSPVDGKPKKNTLGKYPALSLADARKAARSAMLAVSEGRDPGSEKIAARIASKTQSDLVGVLLDEFIERHIRRNVKLSTQVEFERIINRDIRPLWGSRKVTTITRRDVNDLLDRVVERGANTLANRLLALVRKFFNWMISRGVIEASPVVGVKPPSPERSRDRILSDDEIRWLWAATNDKSAMNTAVRLLLLTGQRRGEVSGMTWAELDLPNAIWTISAQNTKNGLTHTVPLSPILLSILESVLHTANSELVMTSTGKTPVSGWSKYKSRLDAKMLAIAKLEAEEADADADRISIPPWRLHDLRRTCASGMARLGQPVHAVEALLNHKSGVVSGIAAVYIRHDFHEEKCKAMRTWDAYIDALVTGVPHDVFHPGSIK